MKKRTKPRIAIVVDSLDTLGGKEKDLKHLLLEFPDSVIYTVRSDKKFLKQYFPNYKVRNSFIHYLPFEKYFRKELLLLYPIAYKLFAFLSFDIVVSISDSFAKFVRPWRRKTVHIGYIVTPPRFFWLQEARSIKGMEKFSYKFYNFFRNTILEKIWLKWDIKAAQKIDVVISQSKEIAKRVKDIYKLDSEVIYPPVETNEMIYNSDPHRRENWFLYHGRVETYKGVELAIRACAKAHKPLKISGIGPQLDDMKKLVDELHAKGIVKFIGFPTDEQKAVLLSKCKALIFPAHNEDFGIVPVEALASGTPVIAHRSGGVLETVSERNPKTGIFFDEYNADSLANVLTAFNSSDFDPANCQKQASEFAAPIYRYKMKHLIEDVYKSIK